MKTPAFAGVSRFLDDAGAGPVAMSRANGEMRGRRARRHSAICDALPFTRATRDQQSSRLPPASDTTMRAKTAPWLAIGLGVLIALCVPSRAESDEPDSIAPLQALLLARVQGEIDIDAAGKVTDARLTTPVPDDLRLGVERDMRAWTFAPTMRDGQPVPVHSRVRITLAAPAVSQVTRVWIDDAAFVAGDGPVANPPAQLTVRRQERPTYPSGASSAGVPGNVLVAVRVGVDGKVVDATVVQSAMLEITARKRVLDQAFASFENAALRAARDMRFDVAVRDGMTPSADDLTVNVPFLFAPGPVSSPPDGQFRMYVRTPKRAVPWLGPASMSRPFGATGGEVPMAATAGPRLLSPVGAGAMD
jgi:TonB family protein